jgi:hypothetical protein
MVDTALTVVCWKWKNIGFDRPRVEYTPEHVNNFAAMWNRHLKRPHEIVCITDDPAGIDSSVRTVPIWNKGLLSHGGCYVRLFAFSEQFREVVGDRPFVSADLDCVVLDSLDPLFEISDDFCIWAANGNSTPYCGSLWYMKPGTRAQVWNCFDLETSPGAAYARGFKVGSDQAHISRMLYPSARTWTYRDGVYSFTIHVQRPHSQAKMRNNNRKFGRFIPRYGLFTGEPPKNARIIFFNGKTDPSIKSLQEKHPWIKRNWKS